MNGTSENIEIHDSGPNLHFDVRKSSNAVTEYLKAFRGIRINIDERSDFLGPFALHLPLSGPPFVLQLGGATWINGVGQSFPCAANAVLAIAIQHLILGR